MILHKRTLIRQLILAALLLSGPRHVRGQTAFHLSTSNGLPSNSLTVITRDHQNNMWLGSFNGLYKQEGARIRCYNQAGTDSFSLSNGELHAICEDKDGDIWIGTTGGLDCLNPRTGAIRHYNLIPPNSAYNTLGYICAIFEDKERYIWVSCNVSLYRLQKKTGSYSIIPVRHDSSGVPTPVALYHCIQDADEGFWLSSEHGIIYYEYRSGKFYHHGYNPGRNPVFDLNVHPQSGSDLARDAQGNLWFVANKRTLARYNPASRQLDTFSFIHPADAWRACYSVAVDYRGNVWIGFRHGGLLVFDAIRHTFTPIRAGGKPGLLQSDYIYSLCEDYRHKMWVTTDEGADIIDYYNHGVEEYMLSGQPDFTHLKYGTGLISYDSLRNCVYIPFTQGKQLFRFDCDKARIDTELQPASTTYVWRSGSGGLMMARNRGLFGVSDEPYADKQLPKGIHHTRGDVIWVMTAGKVTYFKKQGGMIYRYAEGAPDSIHSVPFMRQACLSADSRYLYFIDTSDNLSRQDVQTKGISHFNIHALAAKRHFLFSDPRDMLDDGQGGIWMTSHNGLLKFTPASNTLETFTIKNGLSHNFSFALLLDNAGRLWICSLGGIDWYDPARHEFHQAVDNPNTIYMDAFGSGVRGKDGSLFFNSGNKLYHIRPEEYFSHHQIPPALRLSEVLVNERPVQWDSSYNLAALRHEENRLLIRYGLQEFEQPKAVRYSYRMDGINRQWIDNENRTEILFSNLAPGNYVFHLRAVSGFGQAPGAELALRIRIIPAYWQTALFKVSLVGAILLFAVFVFRRRIKAVHQKAQVRQQMSELASRAIRAQMNPHFIFNSLNAIQELIVLEDTTAALKYLSKFSKLLRLVLHHSEQNLISLEHEVEMNRLYLELESLRFKKSFSYHITIAEDIDEVSTQVPSLLLQPYIENAIWHGLLQKPGHKRLSIDFTASGNDLICEITDNGIGRQAAAQAKNMHLNGRDYESKGMWLARQRIDLINTTQAAASAVSVIDLRDANGAALGTTIRIILPQRS